MALIILDIIPAIIPENIFGIALLAIRTRTPPTNAPTAPASKYLAPLGFVPWSILTSLSSLVSSCQIKRLGYSES